jgi:hypothetical protein
MQEEHLFLHSVQILRKVVVSVLGEQEEEEGHLQKKKEEE